MREIRVTFKFLMLVEFVIRGIILLVIWGIGLSLFYLYGPTVIDPENYNKVFITGLGAAAVTLLLLVLISTPQIFMLRYIWYEELSRPGKYLIRRSLNKQAP